MGNHVEFIFRGIFMGFYGNFTGISKFFFGQIILGISLM